MSTTYQQIYYGDDQVVGLIIGVNGKNVSNYKDTVSLSAWEGTLHWIHWDNTEGKWIVRGSTLTVVNNAIRWILKEETRFHLMSYEREQAKGLTTVTVISGTVSRSSQPKSSSPSAENSNWRDHSQETTTPGTEFYNPASNRWRRCHIGTIKYGCGTTNNVLKTLMECYEGSSGLLRMTYSQGDDDDRIYVQTPNGQILIGYVDEQDHFYFKDQ
jgi:hypothetical protein